MRLKGAKELKDTFNMLTTYKVESSGFTGPHRDFVTKEAWDPKLDGKLDDAKATPKTIFGQQRYGMWVLRGREGVFKHEHKDETKLCQQTLDDDGQGPFAEDRLNRKLDVMRSGQQVLEKQQHEQSNDMSKSNSIALEDMLGLLKNLKPSEASCHVKTPASPAEVAASPYDDDDEQSDDGSAAKHPRNRLANLLIDKPISTTHAIAPGKASTPTTNTGTPGKGSAMSRRVASSHVGLRAM